MSYADPSGFANVSPDSPGGSIDFSFYFKTGIFIPDLFGAQNNNWRASLAVAPAPIQLIESTAGGTDYQGTWGDFAWGALRGAADDAFRTAVLASSFHRLVQLDLIGAYSGLRYGLSAKIFGAPDTNRGQFGYDVGPVLGVVVGGLAGGVRSLAARGATIVYRGLAAGEDAAAGLVARAPGAGNSVTSHVAGQRASQWISATKSLEVALSRFGQNGVVAIDLSKVGSTVVDLSNGIPGLSRNFMLSRWAIKTQEILILDKVPAGAITVIK